MTNIEKIQQWIETNPQIQSAEILGEASNTLFILSIEFIEGAEHINGTYDVEIDETDSISFLHHLR